MEVRDTDTGPNSAFKIELVPTPLFISYFFITDGGTE
jgi:hypothetical protein